MKRKFTLILALPAGLCLTAARAFYLDPTLISTHVEDRRPAHTEVIPPDRVRTADYNPWATGEYDPWGTGHPSLLRRDVTVTYWMPKYLQMGR